MGVIVNTNVQALISQRNLSNSTNSLNKATQRLSTGMKINSAADDAAGLFIAKGLETQLRGSQQCQTNISLGINVLQIAEGDLSTIQDNLMRIKDLATQAANGVYSTDARTAMKDEVIARCDEINRIAQASNFNGMELFTVSAPSNIALQVGAGAASAANCINITGVFGKVTSSSLSIGNASAAGHKMMNSGSAAAFISACGKAINQISTKRSSIGVMQSRLEMAAQGLATTIENISASKSTIMDTDIAATTAEYTKNQILQQISSSMLTQANQAPSIALSLLG